MKQYKIHWTAYLFAKFAILLAFVLLIRFIFTNNLNISVFGFLILLCIPQVIAHFELKNRKYIEKENEILIEEGIFYKKRSKIPIQKINSIVLIQNPIQMIFKTGHLEILTGNNKEFFLRDVEDILSIYNKLNSIKEAQD